MADLQTLSPRKQAWNNLIIVAANEAIRLQHLSLNYSEETLHPNNPAVTSKYFEFCHENVLCVCVLGLRGWGEVSITVLAGLERCILSEITADTIYDAPYAVFARAWLERKHCTYIQLPHSLNGNFSCKRQYLEKLQSWNVTPNGFLPTGEFKNHSPIRMNNSEHSVRI